MNSKAGDGKKKCRRRFCLHCGKRIWRTGAIPFPPSPLGLDGVCHLKCVGAYMFKHVDWNNVDTLSINTAVQTLTDKLGELVQEEKMIRLNCNGCGKYVSTPVPADTIIRAWIECPECVERQEEEE